MDRCPIHSSWCMSSTSCDLCCRTRHQSHQRESLFCASLSATFSATFLLCLGALLPQLFRSLPCVLEEVLELFEHIALIHTHLYAVCSSDLLLLQRGQLEEAMLEPFGGPM